MVNRMKNTSERVGMEERIRVIDNYPNRPKSVLSCTQKRGEW